MSRRKEITSPAEELDALATDVISATRKNKPVIPIVLLGLVLAALIVFLSSILPLLKTAKSSGQNIGEASGKVVGTAVGSVEGATSGISAGAEAGREAGLSAEDTVVEISNTIESNINSLGSLEVLIANVDWTTFHEVGNKYAALYFSRANAVFTVDLNQVTVTYREGLISIVLPKPTVEVKFDPTQTELLADWQRKYFDGTDLDGFEAYLNTFSATKNFSEDTISNYDVLINLASESAVKQITEIANAVRGNNNEIKVSVSIQAE